MKIERFEDGLQISAREYNFYQRIVLRQMLPIVLFVSFVLGISYYLKTNNFIESIFCFLLIFAVCFPIVIIVLYGKDIYYVYFLKIKGKDCLADFFLRNKLQKLIFDLRNSIIKIEKRNFLRGTLKVIVFRKEKELLFEIWPDSLLIGKQWRQEDIYKLYDILIDYQNKLKEKQNSEEETT